MSIWRYSDWLVPPPSSSRVTCGEGNTPLVRSQHIGPNAGLNELYFKLEMGNPTGSYKDRFAAAAISDMLANGKNKCIATSSGNTGSALAAYCAVAGLPCHIATVETAPNGKLKQMAAYGADVFKVHKFGPDSKVTSDVMETLGTLAQSSGAAMQISAFAYSPVGMTGVQTISYELSEQCAEPIDHVFVPAGGGGLTLAVARGFTLLLERDKLSSGPAIQCVQPKGNDTIATPLREGKKTGRAVRCTTDISGLQVPNVVDADEVIPACRASGGTGHLVSDEEVWQVHRQLAQEEGIFCEPAGAVALAGLLRAVNRGEIECDDTVVCLVTGSGFKDEASLDRMIEGRTCTTIEPSELAERLSGPSD